MKVNGFKITAMRTVEVYLPIAGGEVVEFKFRPLRADEDFEKVMPRPSAPVLKKPGGLEHHNIEDPQFKTAVNEWVTKKLDWEFLTSISATDGLEWETVKMDDPNTWANWKTDAQKVFGNTELNKLFSAYIEAQYITEEVMEKARARFLTGREGQPA